MQVKALDHIEDANQTAEPDGNGGFTLHTIVSVMKAGDVYELADDHAQRLVKHGLVSTDMDAALLSHLVPTEPVAPVEEATKVVPPAAA